MAEQPTGPLLDLVRVQTSLGPRVPGTKAHDQLSSFIRTRLESHAPCVHVQEFPVRFHGQEADCANLLGAFRSAQTGAAGALLVGTHFDTRPKADREPEPSAQCRPIPGANDGGSGTAILLHLLDRLASEPPSRDVVFAFFDAEDLGDIDGNPFSLGAEYFACHPVSGLPEISEVLILDMVGGDGMILDIDAHILHHPESRELTQRVFNLGMRCGGTPFAAEKPSKLKYIVCDQWPFLKRRIPSCLLIDIDYPQWHTHADLPEAMSERSLQLIEEVVSLCLWQHPG